MKNHRFLWLRNRTTDNRKCEKARNIKEKRTIEMFNTVSKQLVEHHSSQRDNNQNTRNPCKHWFTGVSFYPIPSIWCLFGVCFVKICSISSAVFFFELFKTAVYVSAVI